MKRIDAAECLSAKLGFAALLRGNSPERLEIAFWLAIWLVHRHVFRTDLLVQLAQH